MITCSAKILIDQRAVSDLVDATAADLLQACGLILERDVKSMVNVPGEFGPRSGNEYARGAKIHTASAPGEPPAVDTGRLKNSITTSMQATGHAIAIGPDASVEYAEDLEFGKAPFQSTADMPRPYLRPVVAKYEGGDELVTKARRHMRKISGLRG